MKLFKSFFQKVTFIALLLFCSGNFLFGQASDSLRVATKMENKIMFSGLEGEMLVFVVQMDNLPVKGSELSILDGQNNIIFEEKISTVTHSCKYKILPGNLEQITFKISGKTFSIKQSFTINYRMVEEMEVKKV